MPSLEGFPDAKWNKTEQNWKKFKQDLNVEKDFTF